MENLSKEVVKYTDVTEKAGDIAETEAERKARLAKEEAERQALLNKQLVGGAKSTAKAEKDVAKEIEQARDKRFKDLKFNLDMGYITEKQYYTGLETLRDTYFTQGSDDWQKYTLEIYNYQKETYEKVEKDVKDTFAKIADSAIAEIDEVKKAQDGLANKLKNHANLFQKVRITGGGKTTEFTRLGDLSQATKELEEYGELLKQLKDRGISGELFEQIRGMDIQDAVTNSKVLLDASEGDFKKYNELFAENQRTAVSVAGEAYADDMKNAVMNSVKNLLGGLNELTDEYSGLGEAYATAIGSGFLTALDGVFVKVREGLTNQMNGLDAAMGGYNSATAGGAESVTNNTSLSLNVTPQNTSTSFPTQWLTQLFRTAEIKGIIKGITK